MNQLVKKQIHDLIAKLLCLPNNKCIWARQNAPTPKESHATLRILSSKKESYPDIKVDSKEKGVYHNRIPKAYVIEIQYFGAKSDNAFEILNDMVDKLDASTIIQECRAYGFAFFDAENVIDTTALIDDTKWQSRAAVDLHVRVTSDVVENTGYVDGVNITSDNFNIEVKEDNNG